VRCSSLPVKKWSSLPASRATWSLCVGVWVCVCLSVCVFVCLRSYPRQTAATTAAATVATTASFSSDLVAIIRFLKRLGRCVCGFDSLPKTDCCDHCCYHCCYHCCFLE
jgi:hypothetical protein